jgi:hypothetical protein
MEVPVDELAQPAVVVDRPRPRTSAHVQLEPGKAKGVLDVHGHQAYPVSIVSGEGNPVFSGPGPGLFGPFLVGNFPDLAGFPGIKVRRQGKFTRGHKSSSGIRQAKNAPWTAGILFEIV